MNEPHRSPVSRTIVGWLAVLAASLMAAAGAGCHKSEPAPASQEQPQPLAAQPKSAPLDVGTAYGDVPPPFPKPGWSSRRLRDTLPLCVFPSQEEREKAPFIQNVHEQVLRADAKVVFGVFGPGCLNEACDARPMLQCWAEQEGNTLVVNSRFFSFHNEGSSCDSECLEVDSSCETPVLKAGKYTVRHGDKTYKLQIPSRMKDPCFSRE